MAKCVSFEELQGEAPSLNQADVWMYAVKLPPTLGLTVERLPELDGVLEFEPDQGQYAYVANNGAHSEDSSTVTLVLVYWNVPKGTVRYPPPKVEEAPKIKTLF